MDAKRTTVRDMRRANRSVLLTRLYRDGPLSRHELVQSTALSQASVSNLAGELIEEGIVEEAGQVESDGGRPRALLRVAAEFGYVVGVDVGETRVQVELFDMSMTARAKTDYGIESAALLPAEVVSRVLDGLRSLRWSALESAPPWSPTVPAIAVRAAARVSGGTRRSSMAAAAAAAAHWAAWRHTWVPRRCWTAIARPTVAGRRRGLTRSRRSAPSSRRHRRPRRRCSPRQWATSAPASPRSSPCSTRSGSFWAGGPASRWASGSCLRSVPRRPSMRFASHTRRPRSCCASLGRTRSPLAPRPCPWRACSTAAAFAHRLAPISRLRLGDGPLLVGAARTGPDL